MLDKATTAVLSLQTLVPSPMVNGAFTKLVDAVLRTPSHDYDESYCAKIRQVASASESELEISWARRIIAARNPYDELGAFPYATNYKDLVALEIQCLEQAGLTLQTSRRVCMIGTGPLPMTAIELTAQRGVQIDHVDSSVEALTLCSLVGAKLGLDCGHVAGSGAEVELDGLYDLVIIAGLAGDTIAEKQAIIDNILPYIADAGRLLVRSARGARELLYPAIDPAALAGVHLLSQYHPTDAIINSVLVYEKA